MHAFAHHRSDSMWLYNSWVGNLDKAAVTVLGVATWVLGCLLQHFFQHALAWDWYSVFVMTVMLGLLRPSMHYICSKCACSAQ